MMMSNRPFAPRFLKKLDEKWMKKHPLLWSSRIHLVLYYGTLVLIPTLLIAFLTYFSPLSENSPWVGNILLSVISIVSIVIWLIYLLRFNPYKRFYIEKPFSFLRTFLLYLFIFSFFTSWIFIPQYIGYFGTKLRFSSSQIDKDISDLNDAIIGEVYHKAPDYFVLTKETIVVSREDSVEYSYSDPTLVTNTTTYQDRINQLNYKYDACKKINDTLFEVTTYPPFNFISTYNHYKINDKEWRIKKYHEVMNNPGSYNDYHEKVVRLSNKYIRLGTPANNWYSGYEEYIEFPSKYDKIQKEFREKYELHKVQNNTNILDRKLAFVKNLAIYLRIVYYLSMSLTMLLFMFRHSNAKAFFLSLLSVFILFLITLVFTFAIGLNEKQVIDLLSVYSAICWVIGLSILADRRKVMAKMIALNLFYIGTLFLPMLVALRMNENWFENHYLLIEILSFVAMLILMVVMYRPLYRKWYTLPDE